MSDSRHPDLNLCATSFFGETSPNPKSLAALATRQALERAPACRFCLGWVHGNWWLSDRGAHPGPGTMPLWSMR